ncbi:MAG TPA: DUF6263 family protein [Gemmatimonadaceae bacterium]|jgi:hypothetical protein|nr:DUF6263 family protein [Gemmatimonadaceae bacterium]
MAFRITRDRRFVRLAGSLTGALMVATSALPAQTSVVLRIRPRVGDTLYTRLDQQVEMTASAKIAAGDTSMTVRTTMLLLSRILVQGSDDEGTTVTAVTDSVAITATGSRATVPPDSYRRQLQGQRVRMRITPLGSASLVASEAGLNPDLASVISQIPATLPERAIAIGESWKQSMVIPLAGARSATRGAILHATYRLDSLSRNGNIAYISMKGTLSQDSTKVNSSRGIRLTTSGSIQGLMLVDRRRGWWTDTRATITVNSLYSPLAGGAPATRVLTRITQHMRTTSNR